MSNKRDFQKRMNAANALADLLAKKTDTDRGDINVNSWDGSDDIRIYWDHDFYKKPGPEALFPGH